MKITRDSIEMTLDEIGELFGLKDLAEHLKARIVNFGVEYRYDPILRRKTLVLHVPKDTELSEEQIEIKYDSLSKVITGAAIKKIPVKIIPSTVQEISRMKCVVGNPDSVDFVLHCLKKR